MVIIEDYSSITGVAANSSITGQHTIGSADDVLVILALEANGVSADGITLTFNGIAMPLITNGNNGAPGDHVKFYYLRNPPVGTYTIVMATPDGPSSWGYFAYTLSGANKAQATPATQSLSFSLVNPFVGSLNVPMSNGLIIEGIVSDNEAPLKPLNPVQIQSGESDDGTQSSGIASAIIYPSSRTTQPISWQNQLVASMTGTYLAVYIEADFMPSIWNPVDAFVERYSIIRTNNLNSGTNRTNVKVDNPIRTPYLSSFLHTVGRILSPPQSFSLVAETELQTSQIVIDRVTPQASASATSLTSDHLVSSADAVMLVFASQMGVSQGINGVTLNGVTLNASQSPSISTLTTAGYFVLTPNVGINTLSMSVTLPTALELVVITLLGVDKKNSVPIFVQGSGLTGSPSTGIGVKFPNSLIIDYVGSLGTSIAEDASQTVYFNQPQAASQAAGSIKLSTLGNQTMNWTTLSTAWTQIVVALRPQNAPSLWFPVIAPRNLSDVLNVNALDDSTNPAGSFYATYGDYASTFYLNSFLHTVGRYPHDAVVTAQQPLELQLLGIG